MNTLEEVHPDNIYHRVTTAIGGARQTIHATMDVRGERLAPLPQAYYSLLEHKMDQGVRITRIAFGTPEDIKYIKEKILTHENNRLLIATTNNYQRMILIDKKILFFAKEENSKKTFYTTQDKQTIQTFLNYFEAEKNNAV